MIFSDTALYRSFRGDAAGWDADFEDFSLTGVLVRERRASDPERPEDGTTHLWFFPGRSACADGEGHPAPPPAYRAGDLVVLRAGEADERVLRVEAADNAQASPASGAAHVRLTLR